MFKKFRDGFNPVDISSEASKSIKRLMEDLLFFVQMSASKNAGVVLYSFLERSGYLKALAEGRVSEAEIKARNIALFFDKVKNYSDINKDDSIHSFAQHLELLQQVGDNPATAEAELEEDAVNILTVHKAKGLEFSIVFLVSLIADRFPGRERKDKIYIPSEVLKYEIPGGDHHLQEERRLFYVGMTRAKRILYLTWARDYGSKRLKKISPFVLEALDLLRAPQETLRSSAIENIRRYSQPSQQFSAGQQVKEKEPLALSFFKIADYLVCPLRYKYRHLMKIPVLPHHNLVYGRVLHNVIHNFLRMRTAGSNLSEEEFIQTYHDHWINEGFLSREHEEMRKAAGEAALRTYYRREIRSSRLPKYLEKRFSWQKNSVKLTGRWDRIDIVPEGAVIIDYKAAEVKDQKEADKLSKDSLQLNLYALSFVKTQKEKLFETRLHFLESDIIGRAQKSEEDLAAARKAVDEVSAGILAADYRAKPEWHNCHLCEFRNICPESLAY
jgi:DNA helicase-2/ATP-dependent DNA helicase PcrA